MIKYIFSFSKNIPNKTILHSQSLYGVEATLLTLTPLSTLLCPNGTLYNQQYFVCDWWFNVDCSVVSKRFASRNERKRKTSIENPFFLPHLIETCSLLKVLKNVPVFTNKNDHLSLLVK